MAQNPGTVSIPLTSTIEITLSLVGRLLVTHRGQGATKVIRAARPLLDMMQSLAAVQGPACWPRWRVTLDALELAAEAGLAAAPATSRATWTDTLAVLGEALATLRELAGHTALVYVFEKIQADGCGQPGRAALVAMADAYIAGTSNATYAGVPAPALPPAPASTEPLPAPVAGRRRGRGIPTLTVRPRCGA